MAIFRLCFLHSQPIIDLAWVRERAARAGDGQSQAQPCPVNDMYQRMFPLAFRLHSVYPEWSVTNPILFRLRIKIDRNIPDHLEEAVYVCEQLVSSRECSSFFFFL